MSQIFRQLFTLQYPYTDPSQRQQARAILILAWLQLLGISVLVIFGILTPEQGVPSSDTLVRAVLGAMLVTTLVIVWLVQSGRSQIASGILLFMIVGGNVAQVIDNGLTASVPLNAFAILLLVMSLAAAVLLTGVRGFRVVLGLVLVMLVWLVRQQSLYTSEVTFIPAEEAVSDFLGIIISVITIGFILALYLRETRRVLTEGVTEIGQWHQVVDINSRLVPIEVESEAVQATLTAIRDELGYGAGWLYLVNREGNFTQLLRMTLGRLDLVEGDALTVPAGSPMAEAVKNRQPEQVGPDDLPGRRRHLLPTSQGSLSVPVFYQQELLGVLDVQHTRSFRPDDVETVRQLGFTLGAALGRIRLLTDLRQSVREQERVAGQLRNQVNELRQRQGAGPSNIWGRYLGGRGGQAIGFDLKSQGLDLIPANDLPPALAETLQAGKIHVQAGQEGNVITVPIRFREQSLGAMSFTLPPGQQPGQRQLDMVSAVAERLGLALENTRLLEQTQAQAQRDRTAGTVAARLIGQTDVNRLLDEAAQSFTEALNAVHTRIYLQPAALVEPAITHNPAEVAAS
jgi:GAF domain-containing protein